MVLAVSDRGTNEKPFCSKSCLELFLETEHAVLVAVDQEDEKRIAGPRQFIQLLRTDKDKFVELPGKKVSVATQTDLVCDFNNNDWNKENKRVALIGRKRNARGKPAPVDVKPNIGLNQHYWFNNKYVFILLDIRTPSKFKWHILLKDLF